MKIEIKILGTGCSKCKKLYEEVEIVIKEMNIEVDLVKVTELKDIINYEVMMTPALVINGKVKIAGRIPNATEIKKWIEEENK